MNIYENRMQGSISINNIEPDRDHYIADNGTIVAKFSDKDNFAMHITPEQADALVYWAKSIRDTFIRNGQQHRMNTFGMFSTAGDSMIRVAFMLIGYNVTVQDVIDEVIRIGKDMNISVAEVNDTAVRESIHQAIENARNSND